MIPDFMRKHYEGSSSEGKKAISKLAAEYEEERRMFFETTFNEKQAFQRDWNRLTGERKTLSHDEAIAPIDQKYEEKAREIAVTHSKEEQPKQEQAAADVHGQAKQEQAKEDKQEQQQERAAVKQAEQAAAAECKTKRQEFLDTLESMRQRQQEMRPKL